MDASNWTVLQVTESNWETKVESDLSVVERLNRELETAMESLRASEEVYAALGKRKPMSAEDIVANGSFSRTGL